ncbi:hypothetical protein F7018_04930 [Tenacibaculum aiptasiae]|uniref:Uncharacterized protein n=1 Tax=Tenacibaculum aiptasiae TaxID=426481 RepID=A0A7J5AQ20_9FLAO|nr:hypothetical protein [Tenacibaculum aiptasiae]KAB1159657.1 hypothetical protein F7018_04930 [Tenacibaculum aiptasiae]
MKKLELNEMEKFQGSNDFIMGLTCVAAIGGFAAFMIASGGGAIAVAPLLISSIGGGGCIATVGAKVSQH